MNTFTKTILSLAVSGSLLMSADAQLFGRKKSESKEQPASKKRVIDVSNKGAAPATTGASTASPAVSEDYVIGVDDVLTINVWREAEMSKEVPVRPDGKISLPLLGEFMASGKTPIQLQADLKKKLETVVTNPEVTVMVKDIRSQKFSILGEVSKPGSYPLTKPMSVLEAIALAGGFKDFANPKKMYILRRTADGKSSRIPFDYNKMLKGDNRQAMIELESRDTIVVP